MKSAPWRICAFGTYIVMRHYKTKNRSSKNLEETLLQSRLMTVICGQIALCKSGFQNIAEDSECSTQALLAFHGGRNLGNVSDKSQVTSHAKKSIKTPSGEKPTLACWICPYPHRWQPPRHIVLEPQMAWRSNSLPALAFLVQQNPHRWYTPLSWKSSESEWVILHKLQPFIETQDPFPVVLLIPNSSILMIPFMAEAKFPCRFSMEKLPCSHESRLLNFSPPGLLRRLDTRFHARLCLSGPRNRNAQKVAMLTGCRWIANIQWFEKAFVLIHFWFYILWGCKENCHFATFVNHTSILMRRRLPNIPVLQLLEWAISSDCAFPSMKYSTILICYPVLVSSFVGRCLDTPAQHLRGQ